MDRGERCPFEIMHRGLDHWKIQKYPSKAEGWNGIGGGVGGYFFTVCKCSIIELILLFE